jgi:hypothetical protein
MPGELNIIQEAFNTYRVLWINPVLRLWEASAPDYETRIPDIRGRTGPHLTVRDIRLVQSKKERNKAIRNTVLKGAVSAPIGLPVLLVAGLVGLPFIASARGTGKLIDVGDKLAHKRKQTKIASKLEALGYCKPCSELITAGIFAGQLDRGNICNACGPRIDTAIDEATTQGASAFDGNASADDILAATCLRNDAPLIIHTQVSSQVRSIG